jgi:hypothetical protein
MEVEMGVKRKKMRELKRARESEGGGRDEGQYPPLTLQRLPVALPPPSALLARARARRNPRSTRLFFLTLQGCRKKKKVEFLIPFVMMEVLIVTRSYHLATLRAWMAELDGSTNHHLSPHVAGILSSTLSFYALQHSSNSLAM